MGCYIVLILPLTISVLVNCRFLMKQSPNARVVVLILMRLCAGYVLP